MDHGKLVKIAFTWEDGAAFTASGEEAERWLKWYRACLGSAWVHGGQDPDPPIAFKETKEPT